ncbi:cytochrome B [Sphingomonas melonis TY]|jgi:ubiquinol-cytochrome c reductase cytochrome b subunit|uniref:Cytochrome b n=3 Tax=Sphingomonadaceae TaxID=41297 RepID=A0A175Y5G3_9SPHN|nr:MULTISPECIES: cytochrome b N-terminal domain-containing protein [Sphingomonadaceae]HEX2020741.1 cytochrome b N-terminal domain-containing protein [Aurantimonas sp.]AOW24739.1 cytochrome b [Sphingomonas melonis TY]KEQ55039.1 cytochrome b [Sphingobium chlorophenolicum]KZB95821.1 cytochrome B [Sphingomonas melonis TY]MBI0533765.1 cytochrome b [Sphingomonas sp. TX0522]
MSFPWASHYEPKQPLMRWIDERLPLPRLVYNAVGAGYPVPRNLNYFWNFGVLAGLALAIQIITGVVLAMHYTPSAAQAFGSVEHIMRDVNQGWLLRYCHAAGASFFFAVVYIHLFRGLYYGSYKAPREVVWLLGVVILMLMMAAAFMGYVLPWGQMSFWGAQVITGFFSAIPGVGETLRVWLLGGYAPDNAALNRFFSLHYLLPFVIAGVIILHIWALHIPGSNNPTGVEVKGEQDTVPFHPYYTAKDAVGVGIFLLLFAALTFFSPNLFVPAENYIEANPLSTPPEIVPEWYFWPFYAILRAFTVDVILPAKLWGVLAMAGSILLLFFLPWLDTSPVRSNNFRPKARIAFWVLVVDVLVLGYCGGSPAEPIYVMVSQIAAAYYFTHFLIVLPIISRTERPLPLPKSITEAVLADRGGTSLTETAHAQHGNEIDRQATNQR